MDATAGATVVASVTNSAGLNCRTNSSSSSSSSGYASGHSTASTPATPISSHYDTVTHSTHTTSVPSSEHVPTATVAPVTPFYSETTFGQQHRQQYYQSYPYSNTTAQYNPVYDAYTGNSYHNLTSPSVERTLNSNIQQRLEKHSKTLSSHSTSGGVSQQYGTSVVTTTCATTKPQATATPFFAQPSTNINTSATTYYDAYGKYKMPNSTKLASQSAPDYTTTYTNHLQHAAAAAATLSYQQQQQHYYAAAKSQLQDVNYAAAVVKPHRQHNVGNSSAYYGSSSAYYDKYIYGPTANAATYGTAVPSHAPPSHPYSPHEPVTADPYRKAAAAAAANAWHWNMEYAAATAGNCRNLPPGGNSSGYLSSPSANSSGRDSFCAVTADKYGKYEKYGAYYASHHHPQQYMTPSTHSTVSGSTGTTRNLWPNTPHHTSHLSSVPAVINDRLSHTLPPSASQHQYPHSHTHSHTNTHHPFGTTASTTTQRQNCCAQPFQQQACYYPRPTQQYPHVPAPNAYATTQPTHYSAGASSNANPKYGAYGNSYKAATNNDLYLTSPFDTPPASYNYGNASTTPMQQRYGSVAAASATFYNDLNVQSAFENYSNNTISQPTVLQPHNVAAHPTHHLSYQTHGTNQNNGTTTALIEYRKPLTAAASDCCMNSTRIPLSNLDQHAGSTSSYLSYDVHGNPVAQAHTVITSPTIYSDGGSSSEKSTPTTKNLSLRDFLASWNEEEEEDLNNATEQLSFINENVENVNYVTTNGSGEPAPMSLPSTPQPNQMHTQQQQSQVVDQQFSPYKNSAYQPRPKIHVGITVDGPMGVETSQYFNLPDIIIDIEKSNNTGASTNAETTAVEPVDAQPLHHHHSPCDAHDVFGNFDVEKELDELQIKRAKLCLEKQLNNEIRILTPEPVEPLSQEVVENTQTIEKRHENSIALHHAECEKSYDNAEKFLKDIELNDNNSHSSNSSTFEKEYETFINRIDLDKACVEREQNMRKEPVIVTHQSTFITYDTESVSHQSSDIKTPPDPVLSEEKTLDESTQNIQDFTMFYKKKRKLMQDFSESEISQPLYKQLKPDEVVGSDGLPKSNKTPTKELPNEILQKPCKKSKTKISIKVKARRRPLSQFYKLLRRGNVKHNTTTLVQKHIAKLKERHLPLIKRKSFKNYPSCDNITYNPRSLMHLAISLVNTKEFQAKLLKERELILLKKNNTSQHIEKVNEGSVQELPPTMQLPDIQIIENSPSITEAKDKVTQHKENLKDSLEEHSSNSNSVNENSSLKEQDDFIGFEEIQPSRSSLRNVYKTADQNSTEIAHSKNASILQDNMKQEQHSANKKESSEIDASDAMAKIVTVESKIEHFESKNDRSEEEKTQCDFKNMKINTDCELQNKPFEKIELEIADCENSKNVEYNIDVSDASINDKFQKLRNIDDNAESDKSRNAFQTTNSRSIEGEVQLFNNEKNHEMKNESSSGSVCQISDVSQLKFKEEVVEHNSLHDPSHIQEKNLLPTTTQTFAHCEMPTPTLPVMRTKASVKMCDFNNLKRRHSSMKRRSKSVSPTSGDPGGSKLELKCKQNKSLFAFDEVENIDKTKFVEKWATSVGLTGVANISMNTTESIRLNNQKPQNSTLEALDLSPPSRNLQKPAHILFEEDSDSSSTTTSSSSTSSNSKSDSQSSSSSTSSSSSSSSSTTNTIKSTATTKTSNHCSTDASDFNELKALEKELSQHKTNEDWEQTETVEVDNYATDSQGNVKKTDTQITENFQAEAQDIADLKKILESNLDTTATSMGEKVSVCYANAEEKETAIDKCNITTLTDVEVCANSISKHKQHKKLENINEDLVTKKAFKFKDNDNSQIEKEVVEHQIYQNQQQNQQHIAIPKLSDLCKIALNSSFVMKNINFNENNTNVEDLVIPDKDEPIPPSLPKSPAEVAVTTNNSNSSLITESTQYLDEHEQRELTVEEALAEMYRQAGVMSDQEDNVDDSIRPSDNGENQAQDFLLINLAEILENSDNENSVFVLECDMNENLLRVMTTASNTNSLGPNEIEETAEDTDAVNNVSTLQLVQILNASDLEIISEENSEEHISGSLHPTFGGDNDSIVNTNEDSYSAIADSPIIHHEEIVPDNYKKYEKEQFLKHLHAKYVQRNVKKFHHANRILRKYRRHFLPKKPLNMQRSHT